MQADIRISLTDLGDFSLLAAVDGKLAAQMRGHTDIQGGIIEDDSRISPEVAEKLSDVMQEVSTALQQHRPRTIVRTGGLGSLPGDEDVGGLY